jgi:hypothetical protein
MLLIFLCVWVYDNNEVNHNFLSVVEEVEGDWKKENIYY